jgi:hypothetical protein
MKEDRDEPMNERDYSIVLGAMRVVESSVGWLGIELGLGWPRGEVLRWGIDRWVSPDRSFKFKRDSPDMLRRALGKSGLPAIEAAVIAESVLTEWTEKVARERMKAHGRGDGTAWRPPFLMRLAPLLVAFVWTVGAVHLVRRAVRAMS